MSAGRALLRRRHIQPILKSSHSPPRKARNSVQAWWNTCCAAGFRPAQCRRWVIFDRDETSSKTRHVRCAPDCVAKLFWASERAIL